MAKHDKPTIFVTRRWPAEAEAALSQHFSPTFNEDDTPLSAAEMATGFASHDAIAPTVSDKIGSDIILAGANGSGRLIANFGVGVNHIDLEAAAARLQWPRRAVRQRAAHLGARGRSWGVGLKFR